MVIVKIGNSIVRFFVVCRCFLRNLRHLIKNKNRRIESTIVAESINSKQSTLYDNTNNIESFLQIWKHNV